MIRLFQYGCVLLTAMLNFSVVAAATTEIELHPVKSFK
jgi:hypothetical protein